MTKQLKKNKYKRYYATTIERSNLPIFSESYVKAQQKSKLKKKSVVVGMSDYETTLHPIHDW